MSTEDSGCEFNLIARFKGHVDNAVVARTAGLFDVSTFAFPFGGDGLFVDNLWLFGGEVDLVIFDLF